ncbi:biopolymer transporter ExbD [Acuticoccus sediminis]|uniref:Biopolymer transporter ExbD n=1 Tax=Acuticoccus sediminis TaxID=2184697 RepID=A0A8B2NKT4_9HYPH|nr:biopolymer transporter ExbD [Acuticoccus sediminis]RAH96563.1 biopolymer transporter ExbD [Acuticoccus sediminis]
MMRMPARRRRRLPLTPLIDVIFLLLLFFMLSSTFLRFADVEVASAGAARSGAASTGSAALLKLAGDGGLVLNGQRVEDAALMDALEGLADDGTTRLVLTAETGSTVQALVDLLGRLETGPMPVILAGGGPAAGAPSTPSPGVQP